MSDTYQMGFVCKNCHMIKSYDIPKGTSTFNFRKETACVNCGVKNLEVQKEKTS